MFKFKFHEDTEDLTEGQEKKDAIQWYPCKVVEIPSNITEILKNIPKNHIVNIKYGDLNLNCLSSKEVMNELKQKSVESLFDVLEADGKHSDLVAGKYEGGLKVWECTKDLIEYFAENLVKESKDGLKEKNVLDLGCGSGHLGIMALKFGANVTFQDYNQEVVESLTIPNVFLNESKLEDAHQIHFYSGDWGSFLELQMSNDVGKNEIESPPKKVKLKNSLKFDFILSSETIYNKDNYNKLYEIFKELLKDTGTAFIAAKSYYFGVGGSTSEFRKFIEKEDVFESRICWETSEGVSREIIEIKFKKCEKS